MEVTKRNPPPFDNMPESVPLPVPATSQRSSSSGAAAGSKSRGSKKDKAKDNFVWEDDEVELLLNCTADYKSRKLAEETDWESVRQKYDEILRIQSYKDSVPSAEDAEKMGKSYKHGVNIFKEIITGKLKAVHGKYREAVDDGRRNGHGRVVLLFFELCAQI